MIKRCVFLLLIFGLLNRQVSAAGGWLLCYKCNSNQPGCGTPFNWLWYWGEYCPEPDDVCVKVIERKGAETLITRDCLSSLKDFRTDIPADHYEGCRPAAKDVRLGHFVNNTIKELDIHRDYYDEVNWCFCYFDNRCNSATGLQSAKFIIPVALLSLIYKFSY
ncbi:Protein of unknown function [Cotesia congregata]|uniref:Protein sleepless n=1 Tax=Cotesia congregata TaxID=51543 RepID=A0A8J2H3I9_COTCN|nr:Protein of unknown function [Cotesia congregata]